MNATQRALAAEEELRKLVKRVEDAQQLVALEQEAGNTHAYAQGFGFLKGAIEFAATSLPEVK